MAGETSARIELTERCGVPVFWLDAPGPVRAGLMFRVGLADESLPRHGITHLVEHLAMRAVGRTPFWANAWVEGSRTIFWAEGSPAETSGFLTALTCSLGDLPTGGLEVERRVLATEAETGGSGVGARLMEMRFGAAAHGLRVYREFGLRAVRPERVRDWAREHFTTGNAAVWMTAPPPDDLTLHLPPGERVRSPAPEPLPGLRVPSQRGWGEREVAIGMLGARSAAFEAAAGIAANRMEDRLRLRDGLTYDIESEYTQLDSERAHLRLVADCADPHAVAVRDGMQLVLDELAEHGPTEDEIEHRLAVASRWMDDPNGPEAILMQAAFDHLHGRAIEQPGESIDRVRALRPADVAAAMREALTSELVVMPADAAAARGRFAKYGTEPVPPVSGKEYRLARDGLRREPGVLVLGAEGVSRLHADAEPVSVRFADCVALVEDRAGTFSLIARDTTTIEVTPADREDGEELERGIRARVPEAAVVPLESNVAELGELAERLDNPARIGAELVELPELLAPGERPLALARARRGRRDGALLATDRRLVWVFAGGSYEQEELPWEAVQAFRFAGPGRRGLLIEGRGRALRFFPVGPPRAVADFERAFMTHSEA